MRQVCQECGKRVPTRNNQVSIECQKAGLCRTCWETTYTECKECGKPLPKGKGLKHLAARQIGYCLDCYEGHFPEPGPNTLPPCRQGSKRLLTPYDRQVMERRQFDRREMVLWDSAFLYEWLEYIHWSDEL